MIERPHSLVRAGLHLGRWFYLFDFPVSKMQIMIMTCTHISLSGINRTKAGKESKDSRQRNCLCVKDLWNCVCVEEKDRKNWQNFIFSSHSVLIATVQPFAKLTWLFSLLSCCSSRVLIGSGFFSCCMGKET